MNIDAIIESWPLYAEGAWTSVQLMALSVVSGGLVAVPLALARVSHRAWLWAPVACFTWIFRGTPLLVQLFLIYYGAAQFDWIRESAAWPWLSSAWFCAVLAFALNTCAYTTEIVAGALRTTARGEIEAARSLGMSRLTVTRRILLPSALRRALPAYSNEVVMMLHSTSLASVVTLLDLTGAAREVNSRYFVPFEAFITAAGCYLLLTFALLAMFRRAERHWMRHLAPRGG
jgi:arginine/ornithine transport system permease protein